MSIGLLTILNYGTASGQAVQPGVFTRPAGGATFAAGQADNTATSFFSDAGLVLAPFGDSKLFAASSQIFSLKVLGTPRCTNTGDRAEVCVERVWFKTTIDTNIVQADASEMEAVREYVLSRKGSPLAVSVPFLQYSSKKGTVRQTWFAIEPFGTFRWIPTSADNASGSIGFGGTGEMHVDFTPTTAGTDVRGTEFPSSFWVSVTPNVNRPFGDNLRALVFRGQPGPQSWVWGIDYRFAYQVKGRNPISVGAAGTLGIDGFNGSRNSIGFSISTLVGSR